MSNLKGKGVLVMGLGLHGGGAEIVKFFAKIGAYLTVTDLRSKKDLLPTLKRLKNLRNIRYVLGRHRARDFLSADLVIKNPGVKPDSPYLALAKKHNTPIVSELGIFFRLRPAKIIGVTGTRGKSTTAYLIWKFLRKKKQRVFLGGNIRKSALEFLPRLTKDDLVVLEISSFQLEDLASEKTKTLGLPPLFKRSPDIAVLTNIMRDHLNWHKSFTDYLKAKSYIFAFQKKGDFLFLSPRLRRHPKGRASLTAGGSPQWAARDAILRKFARSASSRLIAPKELSSEFKKIVNDKFGEHYLLSVSLAVAVARHFGVSWKDIKQVLLSFRGLEGREEWLGRIRGINFVNDTTATSPDAVIAALKRFRKIAGIKRIILIAGGTDKKLDFKEMARAIRKYVDILVLLSGTATEKIKKLISFEQSREDTLRKSSRQARIVYYSSSMREAVKIAFKSAKRGDYIILSPGAASFGLFLNEFDRGEKFVKAFKSLQKKR